MTDFWKWNYASFIHKGLLTVKSQAISKFCHDLGLYYTQIGPNRLNRILKVGSTLQEAYIHITFILTYYKLKQMNF